MDSITQAMLGAAVAGSVAGKRCTPKILLMGAGLGTLPDLDVIIDYGDPISNMIKHRGFTHSLFTLFPFSLLLAWLIRHFYLTNWSYFRVAALAVLCLITHPLLDSFTSYGTQLFWPLDLPSVAIPSLFIIDPSFTLPLLIGVLASFLWRDRAWRLCSVGLALSVCYLSWSLYAKHEIYTKVENDLTKAGVKHYSVFMSPTLFNTVLWRVLVIQPNNDTYDEALISLLDDNQDIHWETFDKGAWPLETQSETLADFDEFTRGFLRYEVKENQLIATDLRLGMALSFPFQFVVAERDEKGDWIEMPNQKHEEDPSAAFFKLPSLWLRLLGNQHIDVSLNHRESE